MELETLVDDLLVALREYGYDAKVTYCINRDGTAKSFEVEIVGRLA